jgi:hypothetical protein
MSAVSLLTAANVYAQEQAPVALSKFIQTMPLPKPSLKEMMAENITNDVVEKNISGAFATIDKQIKVLYQPVYERFQKATANAGLLKLTAAEQSMMTNVRLGAKGLSSAVQFDFFRLQMTHRLPVGGGRPMWAFETPVATSPAAQKIYQQLKTLEAGFNWKVFLSTADQYVLKFGSTNKSLDAINKNFNTELENLPKKKVILTGFTHETADPDKAIALCRKYGVQREQAFEEEYLATYSWWNQHYQKLRATGESLDALAVQLNSMEDGSGRSIQPLLDDLQIRTWEALYKLTAVTQRLYNDRLIGLLGEQQVKEMIDLYTQYKAGE